MRQLISTDSGKLSNTKLWSFIGCGIASWIMVMLTIKDKMTWEIFLAYLGTVGGFSQISKWLAYRYGVKPDVASSSETIPATVEVAKCTDCPSTTPTTKSKSRRKEEPGD